MIKVSTIPKPFTCCGILPNGEHQQLNYSNTHLQDWLRIDDNPSSNYYRKKVYGVNTDEGKKITPQFLNKMYTHLDTCRMYLMFIWTHSRSH